MARFTLDSLLGTLALCGVIATHSALPAAEGEPLRIIAFGAHPDDCELKTGGTGALWAQAGHKVLLVSTTNGDIGHWRDAGGTLANRRREEARKADAVLGVESRVLDIHDGEIMPTLENRRTIVRLIREWKADIVLAPRSCDYHPDHRYTGILVQDAGYMVTVPFFCPDVPHLARNPVFLYFEDGFQRPYPFNADVAVAIDAVIEKKLDALALMESQFLEGGCNGSEAAMPKDDVAREARQAQIRDYFRGRFAATANRFRDKLVQLYGPEKGAQVKYAEAFEVCEYGRRPSPEELRRLFPIEAGAAAK
ncbi:MAG TPA: GlcNAc-PI de-N-acetylase [Planctomycetes bacterium]|nr:GlcNAc-PI de-N-acetylase [Planctomycetota bacterium]